MFIGRGLGRIWYVPFRFEFFSESPDHCVSVWLESFLETTQYVRHCTNSKFKYRYFPSTAPAHHLDSSLGSSLLAFLLNILHGAATSSSGPYLPQSLLCSPGFPSPLIGTSAVPLRSRWTGPELSSSCRDLSSSSTPSPTPRALPRVGGHQTSWSPL